MADLTSSGMVRPAGEARAERLRKGFCDTCRLEPVRCFEIKKRIGGMIRERIPLTVPGKVYNGICLDCHPYRDPYGGETMAVGRAKTKGRTRTVDDDHDPRLHPNGNQREDTPHSPGANGHANSHGKSSRPLPYNMDDGELSQGYGDMRSRSLSIMGRNDILERRPNLSHNRQAGFRNLALSLPAELGNEDSFQRLTDELENKCEHYEEVEMDYVEEIEYNIFNEPVVVKKPVKKPRRWVSKRNSDSDRPHSSTSTAAVEASPLDAYHRSGSRGTPHYSPALLYEEKMEELALDGIPSPPVLREKNLYCNISPLPCYPLPHRQNSGPFPPHRQSSMDEQNMPCTTDPPAETNRSTHSTSSNGEDLDGMDELARLCAGYIKKNEGGTVKFSPGTKTILPNAELQLPEMSDDLSVLTPDTYFQGRPSVATLTTVSRVEGRRTWLAPIGEDPGGGSSPSPRRGAQGGSPMASHQIREPAVPAAAAAQVGAEPPAAQDNALESYLESSSPDLLTLREIVGASIQAGEEAGAIEYVTQALIHDNATSMSEDLALFCLTTLWVLARKSDENKRKIIFEEANFDAIIEAMQIYREGLVEIQTRACGVLWSLSMEPNDRKHVAQGGGCDAILNAMLAHMEDDALQVMAMGALKVLSFDNVGKATLRLQGAPSAVSDVMQELIHNPTIQSEGSVILGNLAVDDASQFMGPVSEKEVEAVVRGILAHQDSPEVHEAACFTLMSLASSAANVELIRRNSMSKFALELALQRHPDDVGAHVLTLLRRLKVDSQAMAEGINLS